jgi:hypothetical protein
MNPEPVRIVCSQRAAALLSEKDKQDLMNVMMLKAEEVGMRRGQSLRHTATTSDGTTELKLALDRRAGPAAETEWLLLIDTDGLGATFHDDPALPSEN